MLGLHDSILLELFLTNDQNIKLMFFTTLVFFSLHISWVTSITCGWFVDACNTPFGLTFMLSNWNGCR